MLTWIEIDRAALKYNLREFRKIIPKKTQLMVVIKGNAYGHGFLEIAKILNLERGVERLCVASLAEALNLIDAGLTQKSIQILSFYELDKKMVSPAIKEGVVFPVYSLEQALFLDRCAKKIGEQVNVHLKIDTGTSRVGVLPADAFSLATQLHSLKNLVLTGVWTHLAASEIDPKRTHEQLVVFNKIRLQLQSKFPEIQEWHSNCTAATVLHPEGSGSGVRVGIGLYGLHPSLLTQKKITLKPVLSWHTTLIQVKTVPKGTKISYDGTFTTKHTTNLGVIPLGYYDGFDRRFSNNGFVLIRGQKCPVLGRVCMNLTMIDLSELKNTVKAGERVTILGKNAGKEITADTLAKLAKTINYEIVDRINPLLPRKIV